MSNRKKHIAWVLSFAVVFVVTPVVAQRQAEYLDRGVVAIDRGDGTVLVSWRFLGTDPDEVAFRLYRSVDEQPLVSLNESPIRDSTNFVDRSVDAAKSCRYEVRPVLDGREQPPDGACWYIPGRNCLEIPLQTPDGYQPNDASVGDLDGDGQYEIVLHQAGRGRDNSQSGMTDPPILEAYRLDGTLLWRIDLGRNIREGAHYTQFMVFDLDGDGCAEVACKTADGTVDGLGNVLGNPEADHRDSSGRVLEGPEYLTVFDGRTGANLATTDYLPARGRVADWGDDYGNRVDRFLACIAYLDGQRPSLVMCRGYYTRTVLVAWNWRDNALTRLWTFDSEQGQGEHAAYRGQGNHSLSVGDVDQDGRDEILYGACAIDDDGSGLYSTGLGHGDAMHLADIDPDRPGWEIFGIHERPQHPYGANLRDAATGQVIWGLPLRDPGRGLAMDLDPRRLGYECWASGTNGLYDCRGEKISEKQPNSCNMGIWWDGDLLREILDGRPPRRRNTAGGDAFIDKWDPDTGQSQRLLSGTEFGCTTNNGSKANPCLCADILGDWREEVIWRTTDGRTLKVFTTTIPTSHRLRTLMHDPVYRLSVAWQNVGYNQPTQTSFYLGEGMSMPPAPELRIVRPTP